jgi:6-pyruvoyltetrahydropterin/6-carboxytetrahydropterin synthase
MTERRQWRICKQFCFEAAHHLPHLPAGHKCARPHGHSYRVEVILVTDALDANGFVADFADLSVVGDFLMAYWDHADLNEVGKRGHGPVVTTSERLAEYLYQQFAGQFDGMLAEVRVSETPKTWASYS